LRGDIMGFTTFGAWTLRAEIRSVPLLFLKN